MVVNHDHSNGFPRARKYILQFMYFLHNTYSNNKNIVLNLIEEKYSRDFGKQTILLRTLYVRQRFFLHTEIHD